MTLQHYNLADVWEAVAERVPERTAVTCLDREVTYAELDERSNRLAHALLDHGVAEGDHVGIYLLNGIEWFDALLACFKIRAVPINVNYRYVSSELEYLFRDSGVVGVIANRQFSDRLAEVLPNTDVHTVFSVDDNGAEVPDGCLDYDTALAEASAEPLDIERSGDDLYIIYTGGTTGMPKGVVWRQEDAFFACVGGGDPMRMSGPVGSPGEMLERIIDGQFVAFPLAPMMHAAAQWTSLSWLFCGASVVMAPGSFDPLSVWRTIGERSVSTLIVVGDAMVRPLVDTWEEHGPFEVSSLFAIGSGGAPLSPSLRDRLMDLLPDVLVTDGFGSSETGAQGAHRPTRGEDAGGATKFAPTAPDTAVLDDEGRPVQPGSDTVGRVALSGRIPLRYHNAPEKTAEAFTEVDGTRWVITGDLATVNEDGSIVLLGRGNQVINTGGEKVFPEEVEAALKAHPDVYDAVVVGVPDDRFGQRVCAVVEPRSGTEPTLEELADHCRTSVAGYKVPRDLVVVETVVRSPVGKPDYRWASEVARDVLSRDEEGPG